MSTEALSGVVSVVILVLAILKRSGLLNALLDALKRRKGQPAVKAAPLVSAARSDLKAALERHEQEQVRLDEERDLVQQFLNRNSLPKEVQP